MYLIRVHDDGDTEIMQVESVPTDNCYLALDTVEEVAFELKDYGHDEDRINEALAATSNTDDWVEV